MRHILCLPFIKEDRKTENLYRWRNSRFQCCKVSEYTTFTCALFHQSNQSTLGWCLQLGFLMKDLLLRKQYVRERTSFSHISLKSNGNTQLLFECSFHIKVNIWKTDKIAKFILKLFNEKVTVKKFLWV